MKYYTMPESSLSLIWATYRELQCQSSINLKYIKNGRGGLIQTRGRSKSMYGGEGLVKRSISARGRGGRESVMTYTQNVLFQISFLLFLSCLKVKSEGSVSTPFCCDVTA